MKKDYLLSFYFFVLFVYTAVPSYIFTISEQGGLGWAMIPALFSVIIAGVYGIRLQSKQFFLPLLVLVAWMSALYLFKGVSPSPYPLLVFVTAYVAIQAFKESLIDRYINTLLWMSVISFIIWLSSFVIRNELIYLADILGMPYYSNGCKPLLFWVFGEKGYRNAGLCWEPGRYSCMLLIGLVLYSLKKGKKSKYKIYFLILLLITTMSTTGYMVFFLFLLVILVYKRKLNPFALIPIAIAFLLVYQLPFMREKIIRLWATDDSLESTISMLEYASTHGDDKFYVPQRFMGFRLQFLNFTHMNFILGEGHNFLNYYINKDLGFRVVPSEGILGVFVQYGLIIGLWCYWTLYKSSKYMAKYLGSSYTFLFLIIFVACNLSYTFWESPLFMAMWMMSFVLEKTLIPIK